MKKIVKGLFLTLFLALILCTPRVEAKNAKVAYDSASNQLIVKYKTAILGTATYSKQVVYANKDITSVRKGPGVLYQKSKKIRMDLGEKITRVGQLGKWAIILVKGKFYFTKNAFLSVKKPEKKLSAKKYSSGSLKWRGVLHWNGWRWTWYSQRRMPGHGLHIPGRHVDKSGYVCDEQGYICLASGRLRKGSIVSTPFGKKGKVYDSGCARGTLDVYTNF